MEKQSGFTLIELVIVIIVHGVLAATAVPKFINLQSDARKAALKSLKGAMESALTLTYSKAVIQGIEKKDAGRTNDGVLTHFGYPNTSASGMEAALELNDADWTVSFEPRNRVMFIKPAVPSAESPKPDCFIRYNGMFSESSRPTILLVTKGC